MTLGSKKPEPAVRIAGTEKIRTFHEKVRNGLEHAMNFMLGTENDKITIGAFDAFLMPVETYFQAYKKKSVMINLHVEKALTSEIYWFFELKTALVLGGMLRMLPASSLAEKVNQGSFDESDQDAFGEVGNQLSGILDRAFRTLTSKNVHLRMDFKKNVYPNESIKVENFPNKDEFVVLLCSITIPNFGTQKLTLLLPRSLYEGLLNLELELDGIQPKIVYLYSWDPEAADKFRVELTNRYTKLLILNSPDEFLTKLDTPRLAALAMDFKLINFPLDHQTQILFKRFLANRQLMKIPIFISWGNATEAGRKELQTMGFPGATAGSLAAEFPPWFQAFTAVPD